MLSRANNNNREFPDLVSMETDLYYIKILVAVVSLATQPVLRNSTFAVIWIPKNTPSPGTPGQIRQDLQTIRRRLVDRQRARPRQTGRQTIN